MFYLEQSIGSASNPETGGRGNGWGDGTIVLCPLFYLLYVGEGLRRAWIASSAAEVRHIIDGLFLPMVVIFSLPPAVSLF